jgi:CRISPR-associated endonuclease Csn1
MNTTPPRTSQSRKTTGDLALAFDVGHSSIGWAVLQNNADASSANPALLGCGAVIFPADDCLASQRRAFRRQRRHIRSTRQRIARIKTLLAHLGVLTARDLDAPGGAWPWKLAARVLCGGESLTWTELWDVLRWYAHNRGYDGNRRWSGADTEALKEDTAKEERARSLLSEFKEKHGKDGTMAEVFCDKLGIDPLGKKRASTFRFKGLNAAFPREIVENEVRRIVREHFDKLEKVDANLERALIGRDTKDEVAWKTIPCPQLKLPARYQGGLLFGQLVPRFDNRIIMKCPITGEKVPTRHCREFLDFRWAMQLANVRVAAEHEEELRPLTAENRCALDAEMRERGSMTKGEFKKAVRAVALCARDNLETMLMHPDAEDALLLDPIRKLTKSERLRTIWPLLPETIQRRASNVWRRGKAITLLGLHQNIEILGASVAPFDAEIDRLVDAANTNKRRKDKPLTRAELLAEPLLVRPLAGRAAYARPVLRQAFDEVMAGKHPAEQGGCLFRTEEILSAQQKRKIDDQTNNHLVRHRLLMLERLQRDAVKEYAGGDASRIGKITVEVNRELRDMSGKTAKEKAQDLGLRLANFKSVAKKLEEAFAGKNIHVSPGLIRKARVAQDLGWTCPYTAQKYDAFQLLNRAVDKDHIIPRSERISDSLDSLVITFSAVNKWKGKRTALKFIEDEQTKPVPDLPNLSIVSLTQYKAFVEGLDTFKGHADDKRRKRNRQRLLGIRSYDEPEFTPGDLTQTSQLVRLGARVLKKAFADSKRQPVISSTPGRVTGIVRTGWNLLGCLATANPSVLDETGQAKTKTEIRDITHLHHAVDACVLALASHFIPSNGAVLDLIAKRHLTEAEQMELRSVTKGLFNFSSERRFGLSELPRDLKEQLRHRLAERRVVQHIPSEMTGLPAQLNAWRVERIEGSRALLFQRMRQSDGSRPVNRKDVEVTKLLGIQPESGGGKLKRIKAALILDKNYGIALEPEPIIIPFHKVWHRLSALKKTNHGKMPRLIRNGQLIVVPKGKFIGLWRVFSVKNSAQKGPVLDLGRPDELYSSKGEVRVRSLLKDGMLIASVSLTGFAACPSTSSA